MPDTNSEQNSKQKWTLAIDLAMNLPEIGPHGHLVAQDKMYRLKQFAAETAGTPVTIVVQETVNKIPEVATSYDDFTHLGISLTISGTQGKEGLSQSDRSKLDLIDFDSCNMGQVGVLSSKNSLAKDMVAGTETIWADTLHYGAEVVRPTCLVDLLNLLTRRLNSESAPAVRPQCCWRSLRIPLPSYV